MSELEEFRREKDHLFAMESDSPLTPEQKRGFKGLKYFPENPELRLEITVKRSELKEQVIMQTSTGETQTYMRYNRFKIKVDGQEAELTIFSNHNGYFLPFVDALAGKETYGAGRYLEPVVIGKDRFLIDFNYAYNPYCAYNDYWSCPLTPFENHIRIAIRAGEKNFHE